MKSINVLAIAPYEGLKNFFISCAKAFPIIELTVITGNMEAAIDILRQYRDYDVIVSRGGTAQLLREKLASPVIEVEVSVYDMLRTIKMAQQTSKRFAIMGFPSMTRASKTVCEILQYDIPSSTIHSSEDTAPAMSMLMEQGVELVIGDVITTDIARKAGIDSLLITSGFESVEKAFEETIQLFQNIEKIQRDAPYKEILACAPRPIALFGSDKQSAYMNPAYIAQMPKELEPVLKEYIGRLESERSVRFHKRFSQMNLDITGVRIDEAGVCRYAYYINSSLKSGEHDTAMQIISPDYSRLTASDFAFLGAESIKEAIENAASCGRGHIPTHITGEPGAGMEALALYTHSAGAYRNSLFITLNCAKINEKHWRDIVDNPDSPINDLNCTIFLKNVHELSANVQKLLYDYMEDTLLVKRHHVLSSSGADLGRLTSEGLFLPELQQSLCGLCLRLPSLNERPGEIPVLASVFISQYNMEFTKQVIGFESEALEYLKAYRWTANLEQLRDIIRQLVITAGKSYISLSDVQSVLTASIGHQDVSPHIDLSKTLAEIEMEIISRVLAEEDMNQSRAAKRLGIGRSTLWRKLADIEAR